MSHETLMVVELIASMLVSSTTLFMRVFWTSSRSMSASEAVEDRSLSVLTRSETGEGEDMPCEFSALIRNMYEVSGFRLLMV